MEHDQKMAIGLVGGETLTVTAATVKKLVDGFHIFTAADGRLVLEVRSNTIAYIQYRG